MNFELIILCDILREETTGCQGAKRFIEGTGFTSHEPAPMKPTLRNNQSRPAAAASQIRPRQSPHNNSFTITIQVASGILFRYIGNIT